jgi:hypothetical protein
MKLTQSRPNALPALGALPALPALAAAIVALAMMVSACGMSSSGEGPPAAPAVAPAGPSGAPATAPGDAPPAGASATSTPSVVAGAPIVAPERTWTWVDVAGSKCADGSPTGIGVNLTKDSDDVLVFLEGGGACWDAASCWGPAPTAFNVLTGYGKTQLDTDPQIAAIYLLDRSDSDNPFRNKNIVYVPYCTGDSFSGDNVTTFNYLGVDHETHFAGHRNIDLYLSRLLGTFPKAKRVWLAGDSAGGFGASFNFGTFQEAFTTARVDVIDDSGQPIDPDPAKWAQWRSVWNMQLPADCADCTKGPSAFIDYYRAKYPANRFGLISFDYDVVIAPFMSLTLTQFHDELTSMLDHFDASFTNGHYFVLPGASHVGLVTPTTALKTWVKAMVSDSTNWDSVRP